MFVYRIVKLKSRTTDLSGTGAFKSGGRWNSKGTYMLYTSENSSLALLESLVHFDETNYPPQLFIMKLEIAAKAPIYTLEDNNYPKDWMRLELLENKSLGDRLMNEATAFAIKIKSAINTTEYNYLLNPLFPKFHDFVKVISISNIRVDLRLVN